MFVSDQLRQFFLRKAEHQPEPPQHHSISISNSSSENLESINPEIGEEDGELGCAEGQSFIIEYKDSKGNESTRRITVWGIKKGVGGCPLLVAKCHERQAQRSFRIDRVKAVLDFDGVVQEPLDDFFVEEFGMARCVVETALNKPGDVPNSILPQTPVVKKTEERSNAIRAICRKRGIPLLCLIARADSEFHPSELKIIHEYAAISCKSNSIELTELEYKKLGGYIRRLRPRVRTHKRDSLGGGFVIHSPRRETHNGSGLFLAE